MTWGHRTGTPDRLGGRRCRALIALAAAGALVSTGLVPGSARAGTPVVNQAAAATQCTFSAWGPPASTERDAIAAQQIMHGVVDMGRYGTMRLATNPTWTNQRGLDRSGNGHQNSLHWLMPLLREGVRTHNQKMINRFYRVLRDWIHDNPPGHGVSPYAWEPIETGYRMLTMTCAAAGPGGKLPWLATSMAQHLAYVQKHFSATDNTDLHQQIGAFAAACAMRNPKLKALASARQGILATKLIHPDGSTSEGAVSYSEELYDWFRQAMDRQVACGVTPPSSMSIVERIPHFLSRAIRPDGKFEAIGDGGADTAPIGELSGTQAEFPATKGLSGNIPDSEFTRYSGGFIFGRSGWGEDRPLAQESFYSIRTGPGYPRPYHGHHDQSAVTFYSDGGELLFDAGQYRYTGDWKRSYVISRAAHNAVFVQSVKDSARHGVTVVGTRTTADWDIVSLADPSYAGAGITLTRTIFFSRTNRYLVVVDALHSPRTVTAEQRWNLGRDRTVGTGDSAAWTSGPGANVSLRWISGGGMLRTIKGSRHPLGGWNSQSYGDFVPSPTVRAVQRGHDLTWTTVIVPRAAGVGERTVSASGWADRNGAILTVGARGTTEQHTIGTMSVDATAWTPAVRLDHPAGTVPRNVALTVTGHFTSAAPAAYAAASPTTVAGREVDLHWQDATGAVTDLGSTTTDSSGGFSVTFTPATDGVLVASAPASDPYAGDATSAAITVGDPAIVAASPRSAAGIAVRAGTAGPAVSTITGKVGLVRFTVRAAGQRVPRATLILRLTPSRKVRAPAAIRLVTDANGNAAVRLPYTLSGTWQVTLTGPPAHVLAGAKATFTVTVRPAPKPATPAKPKPKSRH